MCYKVITVSKKDDFDAVRELERQVNKHLSDGWKLFGGVSVSRSDYDFFSKVVLAQAMIKD